MIFLNISVAQRINEVMFKKNLSIRELSELVFINRETVRKTIKGERPLKRDEYQLYSKALGISLDENVSNEEVKKAEFSLEFLENGFFTAKDILKNGLMNSSGLTEEFCFKFNLAMIYKQHNDVESSLKYLLSAYDDARVISSQFNYEEPLRIIHKTFTDGLATLKQVDHSLDS